MKTAECVSPKHPDKMCDQISDAILDVCLSTDPNSRVAIEVMGGHGKVYVTGEVTSELGFRNIDVFEAVKRITGKDLDIEINVVSQSPEIANGVDTGGAGDQGIMNGYACRGNEELIPQELYLARSLNKFIFEKHPYDGKTQVTLDDDGSILTIVASFQNVPSAELKELITDWYAQVGIDHGDVKDFTIHANPAGDWNQGGFDADTGLTGRKLAVDNYGTNIPIGGGAFSGKDATKVDRSAAYMARRIAVDILQHFELATEATVRLAYAIGVAHPVMVDCNVQFENEQSDEETARLLTEFLDSKHYDLTPNGIIEYLDLKKPQYEETARWGHFGNSFKWDE